MEPNGKPRSESRVVGGIRFLGEQAGGPERELQEALVPVLEPSVERAYLARIEYTDSGDRAVAICLRTTGSQEQLVREIGAVFSPMFGDSQHLDIIFLDEAQERRLKEVCRPFFGGAK